MGATKNNLLSYDLLTWYRGVRHAEKDTACAVRMFFTIPKSARAANGLLRGVFCDRLTKESSLEMDNPIK
jgi:hypothetical protein